MEVSPAFTGISHRKLVLEWLNATFGTNLFPDIFEDAPFEASVRPNTMPQATVDALAIMLSDFGNQLQQ